MEGDVAYERPDSILVLSAVKTLRAKLRRRGLAICISGIDGSGKTTLARDLVHVLESSEVPVRSLHLHQWYVNALATPVLLLYNRYFGRKLLVFDRSIYDNIAVISMRRHCPRWLSWIMLAIVPVCYPKFDYRLYLFVEFHETLLRRPDTDKARFMLLSKIYDEIAFRVRYIRMKSDAHLLASALRSIAVGA